MLKEADQFRYEYKRLDQIQKILSECPVAIQPSGLLEWHGQHNAVGLDLLNGHYSCERAIIRLGNGLLFPPNFIGTYGFIRYPGTVCFDDKTTFRVFEQIYQEQIKLGFKVIVILTGHYGQHQMNALHKARDKVQKQADKRGLKVKLFGWRPPDLIPHIFGGDHARKFETSTLMRIEQDVGMKLVDLSYYKQGKENVPKFKIWNKLAPHREPNNWDWPDDLHDPKVCNPEFGEKLINGVVEGMVLEICDALEELGYPYIPPNGLPAPFK